MSIPAAYLGVVLIWSTTPIAIQWSGYDVSFLFGLGSRMMISVTLLLLLLGVIGKSLPMHRRAWLTYLASGLGIYVAMSCVYWAAGFIPSGWIAVIFGMTPIVTGVMASVWLEEKAFSPMKVFGLLLGLSGLGIMLVNGGEMVQSGTFGITLMAVSVFFHSLSSVWVKRLGHGLDGLSIATGGLLVATPLFVLTWLIADGQLPGSIPPKTAGAIIYLGIFGSVIGFTLYYYLLRNITASRVALITMITPVLALWIGQTLNQEPTSVTVYLGTAVIMLGLASYEWGSLLMQKVGTKNP